MAPERVPPGVYILEIPKTTEFTAAWEDASTHIRDKTASIGQDILQGTQWAVFEPKDERLWTEKSDGSLQTESDLTYQYRPIVYNDAMLQNIIDARKSIAYRSRLSS